MAEEITANIPGYPDKGLDSGPAREPPEQIVSRNQRDQQPERKPHGSGGCIAAGEGVHQVIDPILRPDRTGDRYQNGREDHGVGNRSSPKITGKERGGTMGESTEAIHYDL